MKISSGNSVYTNYYSSLHSKLASGKRIHSAADDPAGLAVSQKLKAQSTVYRTENRNITDSQSLLNTNGGVLSGVSSNLQRMRELALQSSNGIYSGSDRQILQSEIDQLKLQMQAASDGTRFNGISTLDGSELRLSGTDQVQSYDASLDHLGLSGLDVTKGSDLSALNRALDQVSGMQGTIGGIANGMSHTMNSNSIADINTQSAQSLIESADMERTVMQLKNSQIVQQANLFAQRKAMQQAAARNPGIYFNTVA